MSDVTRPTRARVWSEGASGARWCPQSILPHDGGRTQSPLSRARRTARRAARRAARGAGAAAVRARAAAPQATARRRRRAPAARGMNHQHSALLVHMWNRRSYYVF